MSTLARRARVAQHLCAHAARTQVGADAVLLLALEQPIETEGDLEARARVAGDLARLCPEREDGEPGPWPAVETALGALRHGHWKPALEQVCWALIHLGDWEEAVREHRRVRREG